MKRRIVKKYAKQLRTPKGRAFYRAGQKGGSKKLVRRRRALRRMSRAIDRWHPELAELDKEWMRRIDEILQKAQAALDDYRRAARAAGVRWEEG